MHILNTFRQRSLAYGLAGLSVLLLLLLALPYFMSIERVQQAAAVKISGLTGQDVTFSGATRHFSLPFPYFSLRNVQVAGSYGGPALLRAPRIEAAIALKSLFGGDVSITSLTIVNPKISLNVDAQGKSNWQSSSSLLTLLDPRQAASTGAKAPAFRIGTVKLLDGTILYTHAATDARTQLDNVNFTLFWPDVATRLTARGNLNHDGQPVQFSASLQNPAALFQQDISPFDLSIDARALRAELHGELLAGLQVKMEAALNLSSPSLRDLARWAVPKANSVPELGAVSANAKLRLYGDDIVFDNTVLQIGNSRAEGSLAFRSGGKRPFLQGTLDFDTIDLKPFFESQLDTLISERSLSAPIKGDNLSALDMDLRLSANRLEIAKAVVNDAALSVLTRENRIEFSLGDGKIYDGQLAGRLVAETRSSGGIKAFGTLGLADLRLNDALRELFGVVQVTGLGEVSLNLSGEGESTQAIISSLQGEARLRLTDGSLAGIDIARLMQRARDKPMEAFIEARKGNTEIESANARFIVVNGIATTEDARMAGTGYRLVMTGKTSLADRSLDMRGEVLPPLDAPQDFRLPFSLKGPWLSPVLTPDSRTAPAAPSQ